MFLNQLGNLEKKWQYHELNNFAMKECILFCCLLVSWPAVLVASSPGPTSRMGWVWGRGYQSDGLGLGMRLTIIIDPWWLKVGSSCFHWHHDPVIATREVEGNYKQIAREVAGQQLDYNTLLCQALAGAALWTQGKSNLQSLTHTTTPMIT